MAKNKTVFLGLVSAFIFLTAALAFFFEIAHADFKTASMAPAIKPGDYFVYFKYPRVFRRFDIVIVNHPNLDKVLDKRVIGLPGESIQLVAGNVYINGKLLEEPFLDPQYRGREFFPARPLKIETDFYYLMGDNRDVSVDSRIFGPVYKDYIVGKVLFTFWPPRDAKIFWKHY